MTYPNHSLTLPPEFWRQARAELARRGVRGTGPMLDLSWTRWGVELHRGDNMLLVTPGRSFKETQRAVGVSILRELMRGDQQFMLGAGAPVSTQEEAEAFYDAKVSTGGATP